MIVNGVEITHVDALLTDFAIGFRPTGFIADQIFPLVDVPKQSDIFAIFEQEDRFRQWTDDRAPGDMANEVRMRVSSAQFYCPNHALSSTIPDELIANADEIFRQQVEEGRTSHILDALMINWEKRVADQTFSTAGVGSSAAVASAWTASAIGDSDPVGDINTAIDNVQDATGYRPNRMIMGGVAYRLARRHNDVIAKTTNPNFDNALPGAYPGTAELANLFDLEQVVVGDAFFNQAQENLSLDLSRIWGPDVCVYFNDPNPRFDTPTYAVTFNWINGPMPRLAVERFAHDDERKAQKIQAGFYQDERVVSAPMAFLIRAVDSAT